jgi:hypothetical protein
MGKSGVYALGDQCRVSRLHFPNRQNGKNGLFPEKKPLQWFKHGYSNF